MEGWPGDAAATDGGREREGHSWQGRRVQVCLLFVIRRERLEHNQI